MDDEDEREATAMVEHAMARFHLQCALLAAGLPTLPTGVEFWFKPRRALGEPRPRTQPD